MIDRIISYLAQSIPVPRVAEIVGCQPQYVEEVQARPDFQSLLAQEKKRQAEEAKREALEAKYNSLEEGTINQINTQLPFAEFRDLTRLMEIMIRRKQQTALPSANSIVVNQQNNTVVLTVPHAAEIGRASCRERV